MLLNLTRRSCAASLSPAGRTIASSRTHAALNRPFRPPHPARLLPLSASRYVSTATAFRDNGNTTSDPTLPPAALHVHSGRLGRQGDEYILSAQNIADYHKRGYLALPAVLSEEELHDIEHVYNRSYAHTRRHAHTQS